MAKDVGFYFTCPSCETRFTMIEENDRDIYAGEDYTALCCGARVRIVVLSMEDVPALKDMEPSILPPSKGLRV